MRISSADFGAESALLPPQAAFAAKGWNRSVSALIVLCAAWELGEALLKARWLICCRSRKHRVTLVATAIRRRPNAFNFLHQCEMMLTSGHTGDAALKSLTALENAGAFQSAYQVGKLEAGACTNLLKHVTTPVRDQLKEMVRIFGQPKFLLHDGIAAGIFNADYISVGSGDPWCSLLQNSPEVLTLLLDRMKRDFETTAPKMRKPWGLKELDSRHLLEALSFITIFDPSLAHDLHIACYKENLQRVCAAFKACVRAFKDQVPAWFYTKVEAEIQQTCLWPKTDLKLSVVTT
ncbi:Uncharacterized protein SCF082_LOCUS42939 [Durusdinium trenchii]|uniref:Uncharacterized protein n=1 Tax=Durusdinium trenchii TaxID=1381693 RepID=A0ABP0QS97_9DINO